MKNMLISNKANKVLVLFMKGKAKRIKKFGCKVEYFNKRAEKIIMQWEPHEAVYIYTKIMHEIQFSGRNGLKSSTCPFCIKHDAVCWDCDYDELICIENDSNYRKILLFFKDKVVPIEDVLSNSFYRKLIRKIEKKYKFSGYKWETILNKAGRCN